jgi:hypothetical protein
MQSLNTTLRRVREELFGSDVADLMENCDGDLTIISDCGVDFEWQ